VSRSKKDYDVGYKKPPVETRFKKGQSGNRGGRPKKPIQKFNPAKILDDIDNEKIEAKTAGKLKRMTKAEFQLRQLFTKAIKGNLATARLIVKMATEHFSSEKQGNIWL
jgi:hypothetical protein